MPYKLQKIRSQVYPWAVAFLLGCFLGCTGPTGTEDDPSEMFPCPDGNDEECPEEYLICSFGLCEHVCQLDQGIGDGSAGAACYYDADCDYECENQRYSATCTCSACPLVSTSLGGTADAPVPWNEIYTCLPADGDCNNAEIDSLITFELVQTGETISMSYESTFTEEVFSYAGELCEDEFVWQETTSMGADERGCWTFNSDGDTFNKLSYIKQGDTYTWRCVGIGTKGVDSTPPSLPSCEEIKSQVSNFETCPAAP